MALDKDQLTTDLETIFTANESYESIADYAALFADKYEDYAKTSEDPVGDGIDSYDKSGLEDPIAAITTPGTASTAALAFETGVIAFWTGGTYELTTPPEGASAKATADVTTPPIAGPLALALTAIFTDISGKSFAVKAGEIADALDTATKTVIVTITGPTAPPPGITTLVDVIS